MTITSENTHLIVTIAKKFTDEVNGIKISTHEHPEEHVTIQGIVHSVPNRILDRIDYKHCSTEDILPGDTVMFRYPVIFSYTKQSSHEEPVYRNMMYIKGQEFWRCDIIHVLARIRDGKIKMLNGYVMVAPFPPVAKIFVPGHIKRLPRIISSEVTHIGDNPSIPVKAGDQVYFDPRKAQQYKVGHYEFVILRENQILGSVVDIP